MTRKLLSMCTVGLVDFRSDKERTASYARRGARAGRRQARLLKEQNKILKQQRGSMFLFVWALVIAVAVPLSACSTAPATTDPIPAASRIVVQGSGFASDPKTEWIRAMKAAGFEPNATRSFDEMFGASKMFCAAGSALAIAGIARTVLEPSMVDEIAMPARGQDPDEASIAYGVATWKWSCSY